MGFLRPSRLSTAKTTSQPGVSGTFTPDAYNQIITDSSSFSVTIDSGIRNSIQWIAAKDHLLIGTTGGEWRMKGQSGKGITPFCYDIKQQTIWGSKDMQPLVLHESVAYADFVGKKVREMLYDGTDEKYTAPDLLMLGEHITKATTITTMAYQKAPDSIIWATLQNGNLISCTYDREQEVVAWARHPMATGNAYSLSGGYPTLQIADGAFEVRYTAPDLTHTTVIQNVGDLQNMANDLTGNYYLDRDIDASETSTWNGGLGFDPINDFTGTLDGCGYSISGLYINRPTTTEIGLFGGIKGVTIANLTITDCDYTGRGYGVGALVGEVSTGTVKSYIYNCHSSGAIKMAGTSGLNFGMGGLIGVISTTSDLNCICYDSTSSCTVNSTGGTDSTYGLGGFVGFVDYGEFYNCRATGNITGKDTVDSVIGGFLGYSGDTVITQDCSATGNCSGEEYIGGFAGESISTVFIRCSARGNATAADGTVGGFISNTYGTDNSWTDCYAWGTATDLTEQNSAGGFIGDTNADTTFINCYAIGEAVGYEDPVYLSEGGFIGWDFGGSSTYTSCFWDTETSGLDSDGHDGGAVGHITVWMKTKSNYLSAGWNFDTVWEMSALAVLGANSVCVIPSETEDEVWISVGRVINGELVRYIERMKPRYWGTDQADCFFVDSGLTYEGEPDSTFSGLDHLEGETVAILGDGAVFPSQVVINGSITLTEEVSVCHVGLPYTYKLKPMRMDQNMAGTSKGSIKKITEAVISFYETLNAKYGDGTTEMGIDYRTTEEYTSPPELFSGDKVVVSDGGFDVEDPFQIQGSDPLPCNVRCIIPRTDVTGR